MPTIKTTLTTTLAALALLAGAAHAEERIKLGTLAPNGSAWHTLLKEMGQKWNEISGGKVKLVIYPGGVVGNEGDMVKKMRIGQLQAAALTTIGLHEILPDAQAIDAPGLVDSFATLDYVMGKMGPALEKKIDEKGYVVLAWSEVGWVRFFSTRRYDSLADMQKSAKVFCWDGDPASAEAWRAGGFHPVVMSSTDIFSSLQTGLIDTVSMAPLYAFQSRFFEKAKFMIDQPWTILTGATVVRKDVWERVPVELRPKLLEVAHGFAAKIAEEVRRMDSEALDTMKKQGLTVVHLSDPDDLAKAAQSTHKMVRGKVVPTEAFDEVQRLVQEARAKAKR
jgi:TRAP-type C4-dicarboxylate transport system substrate-binding protein